MKITIIFTGKTKFKYLDEGIREYLSRLKHYLPVDLIIVPDIRNTKNMSIEEQKFREGERIKGMIPSHTDIILFDENGKEYSSVDFSGFLNEKMNMGRDICMVAGGAYGFSEEIYEIAHGKISLSRMTFSHQMVRLIIVEQIYRALTIIRGEPYHHE